MDGSETIRHRGRAERSGLELRPQLAGDGGDESPASSRVLPGSRGRSMEVRWDDGGLWRAATLVPIPSVMSGARRVVSRDRLQYLGSSARCADHGLK